MNVSGISNSIRLVKEPIACPRCGSTARIANGLCVSCMLEPALEGDGKGGESLAAALAEIDVRDADWRAGNYQILEEIGRGGMGVIYRARQRHSRRIVALKRVLSYHADSRETLARFRREAEAAASLDHPNILPIYEVSEGEDGLPFFSMKFAPGGSLLDAGSALRHEPRRSVALMAKVARAVHYAHGQGILHRDLKPGNILLDGRGEPLVSDFGLAKWLDTTSDVTRTLTIFGTPGYIAPEQARGPAAKLTSAADVYSLGAILFVLFTGRPPFLGEHALAVIQQAAEKAAPKLRTLAPALDRDLQTICARCLEREPQSRYHSAGDLAEDLERWLQGRPTVTRPVLPSTRIWRWSRRNPVLVGTAAACLFLGAASIWLLRQPIRAPQTSSVMRKPPLSPQRAAEQAKLHQALSEYPETTASIKKAHIGQSGDSVKQRCFALLGTRVGLDADSLAKTLPAFAETVKKDPATPVHERACAAYLAKEYEEAERLWLIAADEAQKASPTQTTNVLRAANLAALSACMINEYVRAREHLLDAEKLIDRDRNPREWADIQYDLANVYLAEGNGPAVSGHAAEADKLLRDAIDIRTRLFGPEDRATLKARRRLALALMFESRYAEMEAEYRELLRIDERLLGPEDPETLFSGWDLAVALANTGNNSAALIEGRRVWQLRQKVLGPKNPETISTLIGLTASLANLGQFREAIEQQRELLAIEHEVFAPEDGRTALTLANLAENLANVGEYDEAEETMRRAIAIQEKRGGPVTHQTLRERVTLAMIHAAHGEQGEAEAQARDVIKTDDKTVGAAQSGWTRYILGILLDREGKHSEAEPQLQQALRLDEATRGPENTETLTHRGGLAVNLAAQGRYAEAETQIKRVMALNEKLLGPRVYARDNNVTSPLFQELTPLTSRILLANILRDQQKYSEAEAEYQQVIQLLENVLGPDNRDTLNAYFHYAYQLAQQGKRDQAKALAEQAEKGAAKVLGVNDPYTREYAKFLEELESGNAITMPEAKFRETFASGNKVIEQVPR